jgi:uncharacterized protein
MTNLPIFKYHPDPISTGSIIESQESCECCGQSPGYIYDGPIFSSKDIEHLCPWCIADGSAASRFDAEFTDSSAVGDYGSWAKVPEAVVAEVARRTPGFRSWQQGCWWTHCGDAAEFLGFIGEINRSIIESSFAKDFIAEIQREFFFNEGQWERYVSTRDKEHSVTTYVFRCRHCAKIGGYADCG